MVGEPMCEIALEAKGAMFLAAAAPTAVKAARDFEDALTSLKEATATSADTAAKDPE